MTRTELCILIRMSLSDLGRDPYERLPIKKPALEAMLTVLRIEQANSKKSGLRADIKEKYKVHTSVKG